MSQHDKSGEGHNEEATAYYSAYSEYARTLRLWLVTYGVGTPAFFVSKEWVWKDLNQSGHLRCVLFSFTIGVLSQILLALLNKYSMWLIYRGEQTPAYKRNFRYKLANIFSDIAWQDALCDVLSIGAFAYGTFRLLLSLRGGA